MGERGERGRGRFVGERRGDIGFKIVRDGRRVLADRDYKNDTGD